MLWKTRISLADRPGTFATIAREFGDAGVNILAMQVFPGIESVTDELVVRTPEGWTEESIAEVVARTGATFEGANPCAEGALVDQPTRFVAAARKILAEPARFPEVVALLFDATSDPAEVAGTDVMEMVVGDVVMQVHRRAPFTATEHARGAAVAALVSDVLAAESGAPRREIAPAVGASPQLIASTHSVSAVVSGLAVGRAALGERGEEGQRRLTLEVDPAWRRRGIGSRLLVEVARLASALGDEELMLTTNADNQAVLPMVLGSGLRGRIKMSGGELTVRVPLRDLVGR